MTASRGGVRTSASSGFIASIRTMSARQPGAKPGALLVGALVEAVSGVVAVPGAGT